MGLGACTLGGCKFGEIGKKIYDKDVFAKNDKGEEILNIVKVPLCYHCNLNCAYCSHFSPIAPKYELPVEVFEKDIKQLQKITKGEIKSLYMLGGEPLLHSNIERIFDIANNYFPKAEKRLNSNGLLLEDMSDSFFKSCSKNNIKIDIRNYAKYSKIEINIDKCYKKAQKFNVDLKINDAASRFRLYNLTKKGNYSTLRSHNKCLQLDNGLISPCPAIAYIRFFNAYFKDYALPVAESDYLNIHKITSIAEIKEYFQKEKQLCKYCAISFETPFQTISEKRPWKVSKYELKEWYKTQKQ